MKKYKQKKRYHNPNDVTSETTMTKYERLQLRIENDPEEILKMKNPSIGLKKFAICSNPSLLSHYNDNITLCLYALKNNKNNLQYIDDISNVKIQEYLIQSVASYARFYWLSMSHVLQPITKYYPSFFDLENVRVLIALLNGNESVPGRTEELMRYCRNVASHDAQLLIDYHLL